MCLLEYLPLHNIQRFCYSFNLAVLIFKVKPAASNAKIC